MHLFHNIFVTVMTPVSFILSQFFAMVAMTWLVTIIGLASYGEYTLNHVMQNPQALTNALNVYAPIVFGAWFAILIMWLVFKPYLSWLFTDLAQSVVKLIKPEQAPA